LEKPIAERNDVQLFLEGGRPVFVFTPAHSSSRGKVRVPLLGKDRVKVGLRDDLLKRAVGLKAGESLTVLDLTAGLLRDARHMMALGCQVTAIERHELLVVAIDLALGQPELRGLRFLAVDALTHLKSFHESSDRPDVIFFDPMFQEPKDSPAPAKESQLLQHLATLDTPAHELEILKLSLLVARRRVVVKRAPKSPLIGDLKPSTCLRTKSVRFDVYFP